MQGGCRASQQVEVDESKIERPRRSIRCIDDGGCCLCLQSQSQCPRGHVCFLGESVTMHVQAVAQYSPVQYRFKRAHCTSSIDNRRDCERCAIDRPIHESM